MIKRRQYVKNAIQLRLSVTIAFDYKNSHKDIDLAGGINLRSSFTDKEIKEESEYYKYYLKYCKLKAKGIDIDKFLEE